MEKAVSGRYEKHFSIIKKKEIRNAEKLQERLYRQSIPLEQEIGKLKIESDWLKKKSDKKRGR